MVKRKKIAEKIRRKISSKKFVFVEKIRRKKFIEKIGMPKNLSEKELLDDYNNNTFLGS